MRKIASCVCDLLNDEFPGVQGDFAVGRTSYFQLKNNMTGIPSFKLANGCVPVQRTRSLTVAARQ